MICSSAYIRSMNYFHRNEEIKLRFSWSSIPKLSKEIFMCGLSRGFVTLFTITEDNSHCRKMYLGHCTIGRRKTKEMVLHLSLFYMVIVIRSLSTSFIIHFYMVIFIRSLTSPDCHSFFSVM